MAVSTTAVFTGSDIKFIRKVQGIKTFRTRVQSSVLQPWQCFIKGRVELPQMKNLECIDMFFMGLIFPFQIIQQNTAGLEKKKNKGKGENIQDS